MLYQQKSGNPERNKSLNLITTFIKCKKERLTPETIKNGSAASRMILFHFFRRLRNVEIRSRSEPRNGKEIGETASCNCRV
jgi:hypothetical protein